MASYQICKRCGKKFNPKRDTGVSFFLKSIYCSRRCESASKKQDPEYYKSQKQFEITCMAEKVG